MKRLIRCLWMLLLITWIPLAHAGTGIPDPAMSYATSNAGCLLVAPAGNDPTLASRGLTVTVGVMDGFGLAIVNYPFQDIWLHQEMAGELAMCPGGSVADANTNASGETTISGALAGGGSTQAGLRVYISGLPIIGTAPLSIDVVSPDIDGDLVVNLVDLGSFSGDYANEVYDHRSDLSCDGLEDLRDVSIFSQRYDEACP